MQWDCVGAMNLDNFIDYVTPEEGRNMVDRMAQKYLGMSGEAFVRHYHAETLPDHLDHLDVARIAILIPFWRHDDDEGKKRRSTA